MGIIEFKHFSWNYSGYRTALLKKINLNIEEGEFIGLIGNVGSGRSTLLMSVLGLIPHMFHGNFKGEVIVDGVSVKDSSISELSRKVGLVLQSPSTQLTGAGTNVEEELAFGLENLGVSNAEMKERVNKMIEIVGLESFRKRSPYELSGGQQQKVAIASVLIMEPKILVMDEPTAQLDPLGTAQVFDFVNKLSKNKKMTIMLNTQKIDYLAEFADRIILMDNGRIVKTGSTREILADTELLRKHKINPTVYTQLSEKLINKKMYHGELALTLSDAEIMMKKVKRK